MPDLLRMFVFTPARFNDFEFALIVTVISLELVEAAATLL